MSYGVLATRVTRGQAPGRVYAQEETAQAAQARACGAVARVPRVRVQRSRAQRPWHGAACGSGKSN